MRTRRADPTLVDALVQRDPGRLGRHAKDEQLLSLGHTLAPTCLGFVNGIGYEFVIAQGFTCARRDYA
jgi:hypothetical protein